MRRTIGVAIAIPEPYGGELQTHRERFGDPSARYIPTHVTLLPPTSVSPEQLPDVETHLSAVAEREQSFELHLRGTGSFRPVSPVVFINLVRGISDCERIEAAVRSGPLARELSFNYHPHVTVAHDVAEEALDKAFEELATWEARVNVWGFSLYEHGDDGVWRPQRDFPFGSQLPGPTAGHPQPRL